MNVRHSLSRRTQVAISAGIGAATLLLVSLLYSGWARNAWRAAAAVLLLTCWGVCAWVALESERSAQTVRREAERLAAERRARAAPRSGPSTSAPPDSEKNKR